MKRLLWATEVLAWTLFFAFAALILALRFWLLPDIERYRPDIVAAVTRAIGQPVKIGAIEAGWLGLRPKITFSDVRIYDAGGREALVLPSVENVVAWRSLVFANLRLQSLVIERPRLAVRRDAAGAITVAGIKLSDEQSGDRRLGDWVLSQEDILIRNAEIEWLDEKRGAPPLALSGMELRLQNSGDQHGIGFKARPPAALGSTLELRAQAAGRTLADASAWDGKLYLELGYTDLAGWRAWIDYPLDVRSGQGALRLWATMQKGEVKEITADVQLASVAARLGKDTALLELASVAGRLQGVARGGGYDVAGKQLAFVSARGPAMQPADFRVTWRPAGKDGAEQGSISGNAIQLDAAAHIVDALPIPAELRRDVAELSPRGRLLDVKLEWAGPMQDPVKYSARARFSELGVRARGNVPGFANLSGSFEATEARGSVSLASKNAAIDVPAIFAEPRLPFESLALQLDWERKGARAYHVRLASLNFAGEHVTGNAQGTYSWTGEGPGSIDFTAHVPRADARHTARYLPRMLHEEADEWLRKGIVGGQASDVRVRLKGDLRDFPFRNPSTGQFQVTAKASKAHLHYGDGWPDIHDAEGDILFERDRMQVTGRSATVLGARLSNVYVSIPRLGGGAHLLVDGTAEGPTSEFLKFIEQSPVSRMTDALTRTISASGRGKLQLKLDLPLKDLRATKVEGGYDINGNTVTVHSQLPPVERVTGRVQFTESGFSVNNIHGRIFGGPVALSGGSRQGAGVEVFAKGDATIAGLQGVVEHPWRRFFTGATGYVATMQLREGRLRIGVESNLRGVAISLPPPLEKLAADPMPLRIEVIPAEGGARERISVSLGRVAAAELLRRRQGEASVVQRSSIWLTPTAGEQLRLPERPGTLVYGSLDRLDFDRWQPLLSGSEGGGASEAATALDLKIGALDAFGKRVNELSLRAGADASGWSATVQSKELAGDVSYRSEKGGALVARLAHFTIPKDSPGAKPAEPQRTRDLPSVDLVTERFNFRGKQFGRVEVLANRADKEWRIDKLTMVNTESSFSGKGLWRTAPSSNTTLTFQLEASDVGKLLERVGYPDLVRAGKAKVQATLSWNGDPLTPDYPSLSGPVQLQAENGQFLEIEPGIGKLISLMSLQMLPRRLSLDFRDVFSKGFQFDRINAAADTQRGVMKLKDFKMRGPAAEVEMAGEIDLAREAQNLQVRVVPTLGDTASTVVALINPLLIFPAAIAQRILKDPLGHIFAFDYSITGSWTDPKVAKTRVAAEPVKEPPSGESGGQ
jgi:uncharacterized protein (TIGR02099 family)